MASDPVRAGLRGPDGHLPLDFRGVPRRGGGGSHHGSGCPPPPCLPAGAWPGFQADADTGGGIMAYPGGHPRAYRDVCVWSV